MAIRKMSGRLGNLFAAMLLSGALLEASALRAQEMDGLETARATAAALACGFESLAAPEAEMELAAEGPSPQPPRAQLPPIDGPQLPPTDPPIFIVDVCDARDSTPARPLWSQQPDRKVAKISTTAGSSSLGQVVACNPATLGKQPVPEGGNPHPKGADLQNVSVNFHVLQSIEMLASVLSKATATMQSFDSAAGTPAQKGKCICKAVSFSCNFKDKTREECADACKAKGCGQGTPLWLSNDIFKDTASQARYALQLIHLLDTLRKFTQSPTYQEIEKALKAAGSDLQNLDEILAKLQCWVDHFTEGYHLGAYSDQRPDLHMCVGYEGHGAYARLAENAKFDFGARYTSHNLSASHRAQLRTGGFALTAFGRNLSLLPGAEVNLQVDGYRIFDSCKPLGISALGGGALCGPATSPALWLGDGAAPSGTIDVDKVDLFHLVDRDVLKGLDSNGDSILNPGEFLVADYMPFAYDSTQWPRPDWKDQPWEGKSAAVFSAGININPRLKPIEKVLPTITLAPGAFATPILRLEAGVEWQHEAYKLRTRLQDAINRNLATGKLDSKTFERDMHAFQAPDVSAENGTQVSVKPSVDLRFVLGLPIGSHLLLGVAADLGLGVDLEPAGYGGVVDLSRGLVEALDASNPPADAPCTPVFKTVRHPVCSDSQFDARGTGLGDNTAAGFPGGSDPKTTFSCAPADAARSCCLDVTISQRGTSTVKRVCIDGWTGITKEICTCTGAAASCIQKVESYLPADVKADLQKAGQALAAVKTSWSDKQTCGQRSDDNSCRASYPIPELNSLSDCAKHGRCQVGKAWQYDLTEDACKARKGTFTPYQCVDKVEAQVAGWQGAGCHPLAGGFASACGCAADRDCAAGEKCDAASHACTSPGHAGCACDPAVASSCGPGRRCADGACVKLCAAAADCGNSLACEGGACVPAGKVPFTEQVVWKASHPVKPMHAISTYALADLPIAAYLSAGVRVGLTFKLFGRTREFLLLHWSDAWDIGSTRKTRYQPGLEATYQEGCDPDTGVVTNYQPGAAAGIACSGTDNLVCRYPSSQSPDWAKYDQPSELLQTCKQAMPGNVEDPPAPGPGDFGQSLTDLIGFGLGIGEDLWKSQQLCVGNGTLLDWIKGAGDRLKTTCKYTGPTTGAPPSFPCADVQSYLLQIWGCVNAGSGSGANVAKILQSQLPGHKPPFVGPPKYKSALTQPPVLDLASIVADPEAPLATAGLNSQVRGALTPAQQATVLAWLNGVDQCFSQHQADETRCRCTTAAQCKEGETCAGGACRQADGLQAVCPVFAADAPRARPCCGDGIRMAWEQCDDGNTRSGDGCSWDCHNEKIGPFACCIPGGCRDLDPAGPGFAECTKMGGTPFLGKKCSALNQCGHPPAAGSCTQPDGRCQSPVTAAQCTALHGAFATGPCPPPPGPDLYVSGTGRIFRFDGRTGAPKPAPGNPGAVLVAAGTGGPMQPYGLAFGADGMLYASNFARGSVMRFSSQGVPAGIAGNPTDATWVLGGAGGMDAPEDLAFGPDGLIYVANHNLSRGVLRFNAGDGQSAGTFVPNQAPRGLAFGGPSGDLYIGIVNGILRFDRATGAPRGTFAKLPASDYSDLVFGPDGDLYVTSFSEHKVLRFSRLGTQKPDFVPAKSGGLTQPMGLAFGPDGNLYVASAGTNQVLRYNGSNGAFLGVFASGGEMQIPLYLVFGP